jgi:hypothetical protein
MGDSHIPHRAAQIPDKFQKMLVRPLVADRLYRQRLMLW